MGAIAILRPGSLVVDPGGEASAELTVRNSGGVVDQFALEVLGDSRAWAEVDPPTLSLFPGAEGVATVRFRPPRVHTTRAGTMPFGVRVSSKEDPAGSVVEEGVLDVAVFSDVLAELVPRTSKGRRSARHDLAVDNRGNGRINASLSGIDPDNVLTFHMNPPAVVAEPGTAAFSRVGVRPGKAFWRGPARTHPFQAIVNPEGAAPLAADGAMVQEALIPRWLPKAIAMLAALALLAVALWFGLLKPTIKSTAKKAANEAVQQPLSQVQAQLADVAKKVGATPATIVPTPSAVPTVASGLGDPFSTRLAADVKSGDTGQVYYQVPDGKVLSITDIVFQNPQGNLGMLRVRRGGDVLLEVKLDNFRDLDYHFLAPLVFRAGSSQRLTLSVDCRNADAASYCTPAALFGGFLKAS